MLTGGELFSNSYFAPYRCSYKKVFRKYVANLQENIHAKALHILRTAFSKKKKKKFRKFASDHHITLKEMTLSFSFLSLMFLPCLAEIKGSYIKRVCIVKSLTVKSLKEVLGGGA